MQKFIGRLITILIAGYLFFSFLQFKGGKSLPQAQMLKNLTKTPTSYNSSAQSPDKEKDKSKGNFIEKTITNIFLNVLETEEGRKIAQNINPSFKEDLLLSYQNHELTNLPVIIKEGIGEIASCGDKITFDYSKYNSNKQIILGTTSETFTLNEKLEPIFKLLLAKVKSQEEIENQTYQPDINNFETYKINIKKIQFNSLKNPKHFLKQLQIVNGTGKKALCGDSIKLQITLEKTPNDKEPFNYHLTTTLGSKDLPREIIESLLTQRYGTKITFATNKELLNSIMQGNKKFLHIHSLSKDSFAILTVELLQSP